MDLTTGKGRVTLNAGEVAALRAAGVLIEDPRRERPRYFDGRFLAARDLIRDQQYILTREADLGRAAGSGVAAGLEVSTGGGDRIEIGAGHGVTPAGELVVLPRAASLRLADVPQAEQLSARFGLGRIPQPPLRNRSGLFVLALRPVEFTDNPVGAYPKTITGPRTVEDADTLEATAVVLVPWNDDAAADALEARRGHAAATIFAGDGGAALSSNVLPLAMIALQNNLPVWVDAPMVRRELGADRADLPGLGYSPRALRLAHLLQHQLHLADAVAANGGRGFAAQERFDLLPPAGPLPPGMIDTRDFTQRYFPAEMAVDFSIIPEDELPALVEESLALPPIDLSAAAATLEATSVLILAPVPRNAWRAVSARLSTHLRSLRPAAINLVATRKPLEILQQLRIPRALPPLNPTDPADAEWARLAALPSLWFVRRRNLAYRDELAGEAIRVAGQDSVATLAPRLSTLGLDTQLERVLAGATPRAALEVNSLLGSARFSDSPTLTAAAIGELARAETLDQAAVLKVAAELSAPGVGDGLVRLETTRPDTVPSKTALREIASGEADWRAADTQAALSTSAELKPLAHTVLRPQPVRDTVLSPAAPVADTPTRPRSRSRGATPPAAEAPAADTPGTPASTSPSGRRRNKAAPAAGAQPAATEKSAPKAASTRRRKPGTDAG
jgi:hypothetical protein